VRSTPQFRHSPRLDASIMDGHTHTHTTALLDLPDELLDQILAELKWGAPTAPFALDSLQFYENLTQNTASIQLVRLTCRRLASRASPLLLPVASVSISDPSSVDRLEEIARHGIFAPYVKAVHVCFDFYEADPAADPRSLAGYLLHIWRDSGYLVGPVGCVWAQTFSDWHAFCCGMEGIQQEDKQEESQGSMKLLSRLRLEYRRRYEAQQRLASSVVQRIANAMALMPRATRLVLDDGPDTPRVGDMTTVTAPFTQGDLNWLVPPMRWATAFKLDRGSPPIEALFSLPTAVHKAGIKLTGLRIHRLQLPDKFPLWRPAADQHWKWSDPPLPQTAELREACRSLRVFEFTPGYEWDRWSPGNLMVFKWPGDETSWAFSMGLYEVFEYILTASRDLTHVRASLQVIHAGVSYNLSRKNPGSWPWPQIRVFHLERGFLDTKTLPRFLSATSGTLTELHLDGMYLCSSDFRGFSWSWLLDQLREHYRDTGGGLTIRLRRPRGGEFVRLGLPEADAVYLGTLFDSVDDDGLSAVDRFIQGMSDCNPMVEAGRT